MEEVLRYFGELMQTYRDLFGIYPSHQALRLGIIFEKVAFDYLQRQGFTCFWVSMCPATFLRWPFIDLLCIKNGQCYVVMVTGYWGKVHPREWQDVCRFSRGTGCKLLWVGIQHVDPERVCIGFYDLTGEISCERRLHMIPDRIRKKVFTCCETVYLGGRL